MEYVLIGNSTAAIGTIEGIRKIDQKSGITVISDEPYHTYSRPLISYYILGKTDEQRMKYRSDDFYDKYKCDTIFSKKAVKILPESKRIVLSDHSQVDYDKLMIATGSSAFTPAITGLEKVRNKFTFMSLDDAKKLDSSLCTPSNVLIVGAGLIGLKCAEGIQKKAQSITVVDLAPRILPSILDDEGSAIMKNHLEGHNIKFHLSSSVVEFDENSAILSNGEKVVFDVLVIAVGVRPNTMLVKEAGGLVNSGIVTNSRMETSITDVYAAGDCTESFDITSDSNRILALLPNAYMQGECAGINMAGGDKTFENAIPMNAIGFFGLHVITAGSYVGEAYSENSKANDYKKLFVKDDRLKGYIMMGNIEKAGIYTSLIRESVLLSKLDFGLIREKPGLIAFSKETRLEKLGGNLV